MVVQLFGAARFATHAPPACRQALEETKTLLVVEREHDGDGRMDPCRAEAETKKAVSIHPSMEDGAGSDRSTFGSAGVAAAPLQTPDTTT